MLPRAGNARRGQGTHRGSHLAALTAPRARNPCDREVQATLGHSNVDGLPPPLLWRTSPLLSKEHPGVDLEPLELSDPACK
jgi:hypothetical protein